MGLIWVAMLVAKLQKIINKKSKQNERNSSHILFTSLVENREVCIIRTFGRVLDHGASSSLITYLSVKSAMYCIVYCVKPGIMLPQIKSLSVKISYFTGQFTNKYFIGYYSKLTSLSYQKFSAYFYVCIIILFDAWLRFHALLG